MRTQYWICHNDKGHCKIKYIYNVRKIPQSRWPEIKKAEDDPEIHKKLSDEFIDTYWSDRDKDVKEAAKGLI